MPYTENSLISKNLQQEAKLKQKWVELTEKVCFRADLGLSLIRDIKQQIIVLVGDTLPEDGLEHQADFLEGKINYFMKERPPIIQDDIPDIAKFFYNNIKNQSKAYNEFLQHNSNKEIYFVLGNHDSSFPHFYIRNIKKIDKKEIWALNPFQPLIVGDFELFGIHCYNNHDEEQCEKPAGISCPHDIKEYQLKPQIDSLKNYLEKNKSKRTRILVSHMPSKNYAINHGSRAISDFLMEGCVDFHVFGHTYDYRSFEKNLNQKLTEAKAKKLITEHENQFKEIVTKNNGKKIIGFCNVHDRRFEKCPHCKEIIEHPNDGKYWTTHIKKCSEEHNIKK